MGECLSSLYQEDAFLIGKGTNLAHTARFALVSFLLQINMSPDQVIALFNTSPDFDEEQTRYQVEHIAGSTGTQYKPPSCATMTTYGNCPGEDELCRRVGHPLSYYERKVWTLTPLKPWKGGNEVLYTRILSDSHLGLIRNANIIILHELEAQDGLFCSLPSPKPISARPEATAAATDECVLANHT